MTAEASLAPRPAGAAPAAAARGPFPRFLDRLAGLAGWRALAAAFAPDAGQRRRGAAA